MRQSLRSRLRSWVRTPARPHGLPMAHPRLGLRATCTRMLRAMCGSEWIRASGRSSAPTSSETSRGFGDLGGSQCCTSTGAWPSSVARSQGLGIPWLPLGCPCRLRGRTNIPENHGCLSWVCLLHNAWVDSDYMFCVDDGGGMFLGFTEDGVVCSVDASVAVLAWWNVSGTPQVCEVCTVDTLVAVVCFWELR